MKKLIVVIAVWLCGCSHTVEGDDIEKAQALCKDHGGVVSADFLGLFTLHNPEATCKDGLTIQGQRK